MALTALVLAGGPADAVAAYTPGAPNKAFVEIGGATLVERTLRALAGARSVRRIIVVAPAGIADHPALALADERRPDGVRISESLRSGLAGLSPHEHVLISTSDLPVLTARGVEDFLERACASGGDLTYGCIAKDVHLASYPQVPHTWARFADGTYCGTGLVTMRPRVWPSLERFIERLGRARKNPLRLAGLFGPAILLRFALGRLTIAQAQEHASRIIGAPVRAIVSPYPEIGVNVDRPSDVALAEELIRSTSNG